MIHEVSSPKTPTPFYMQIWGSIAGKKQSTLPSSTSQEVAPTPSKEFEYIERIIAFDPLSIIILLGTVTKVHQKLNLSAETHMISLQEPGFFQTISRTASNTLSSIRLAEPQNRNNLKELEPAIEEALKVFPPNTQELQKIYQAALNGLNMLKTTYENDSGCIGYCLNYYTQLIGSAIVYYQQAGTQSSSDIKTNTLTPSSSNPEHQPKSDSILNTSDEDSKNGTQILIKSSTKDKYVDSKWLRRNDYYNYLKICCNLNPELYRKLETIFYKNLKELWPPESIQTVANNLAIIDYYKEIELRLRTTSKKFTAIINQLKEFDSSQQKKA